jgi:hypothetical protein
VLGVERLERSASAATSAALLAGCCAALAWWIERRPTRAATLRRVERRQALDGALVAFDELAHAHTSRFEGLLAARLATRLSPSTILRASAPSHPDCSCSPLLTCAFYQWARDAGTAVAPPPGIELSAGVSHAPDAPDAVDRLEARAGAATRGATAADARVGAASQRRSSSRASSDGRSRLPRRRQPDSSTRRASSSAGRELERGPDLPADCVTRSHAPSTRAQRAWTRCATPSALARAPTAAGRPLRAEAGGRSRSNIRRACRVRHEPERADAAGTTSEARSTSPAAAAPAADAATTTRSHPLGRGGLHATMRSSSVGSKPAASRIDRSRPRQSLSNEPSVSLPPPNRLGV